MDFKIVEYLERLPIFSKVSHEVLVQLADNAKLHELEKDEYLIRKDDPSTSLFIISKGWIKVVTAGPGGKEIMLNQLGPGQVIGEASMLNRSPRSASVITIRPVQVIEILYDTFLVALEQNTDLAMALAEIAFERLSFSNLYIEKATEWSLYVAEGNYDAVQNQLQTSHSTVVDMNQTDEVRVGALLSAFFKMVSGVKKREEDLKQQILQFKIEIDEKKKERDVDKFIKQSMFFRVKEAASEARRRRKKRKSGDDDEMNDGEINDVVI